MMTASAQKQVFTFDEVYDMATKHEENTAFEAQDMSSAVFEKDSEFGSLTFANKRYELNQWSARQLCRSASISWGFFDKASSDLLKSTFKEFLPAMKDPQKKFALKYYGTKKTVVRGILPIDYPDLRTSQVLESLGTISVPFVVESAPWVDQNDSPVIRTRIVFNEFVECRGDKLQIGIDSLHSELGACAMETNLLLFRQVCSNGAIATYGKKPFFYFDYKSASVPSLDLIFKMSMERASSDSQKFLDKVERAAGTIVNPTEAKSLFEKLYQSNYLNKGVAIQAMAAIDKDGCSNMWDVVNYLTAAAKGYRDLLRLRYERAAGGLLGMDFDRRHEEADLANTIDVLALPPSVVN